MLEKEGKLAFAESINQQLTARVSKLTQREASNADYVRKLESRLDEKDAQAAGADQVETKVISELRTENQRLRDHEQSSEAYLAVLEENLAEADADIEFWKREVDRLEKVVERQRGLKKLDTLLDELDEVQQEVLERAKSETLEQTEVVSEENTEVAKDITVGSQESVPTYETGPPNDDKENKIPDKKAFTDNQEKVLPDDSFIRTELSNLRKSHEITVRKLEDLTNTYNSSLECIAELREQLEDVINRGSVHTTTDTTIPSAESPSSEIKEAQFLESAGVRTLKTAALAEALLAAGPQRSFSRSLSSEHSLAGVSESYKNGLTNGIDTQVDESDEDVEVLKDEIEDLRQKVQGLEELRREHAKLTENYNESMDLLDELKLQLQRPPPSPIVPVSPIRPGLIRSRSISDLKMVQMNDRATRALDTLSLKIAELGADDEELKHTLHSALSVVTTEVISKSSQCQQQATEITALRADVDGKSRLITGLTKAQSRYIPFHAYF